MDFQMMIFSTYVYEHIMPSWTEEPDGLQSMESQESDTTK